MRIDRLELTEVPLRLKSPFRTSFGVEQDRRIVIASLVCDGVTGIAECVAGEFPGYSYETTDTAWHVISDFIAPAVVGKEFESAAALLHALSFIRGHNMAVAAVEMAYWDLKAKQLGVPLFELLGGTDRPIPVGISLGIQDSVQATVDLAAASVAQGYGRIKLKIEPGWDQQPVRAVREALPGISLTVDANSAYTLNDAPVLESLDEFGLTYMEQPLAHDDILDHAELQARIGTAICLDESIHSPEDARKALTIGAGRIINMKVGRVRGFRAALAIHDIAAAFGAPVWCGGMLESGVGRAANLHLSSLPNFRLPGDTSSSSRYWDVDIINEPLEARDGVQAIPKFGAGIGVTLNTEYVARVASRKAHWG
ncbi:MAG: o-succinylbenzoate synthase [Trueperaceae bacterium]|nr:o-succinylbenzoate synthase [Trueperaceae bacterium]MCO5173120.1 o-succinylbenzoate synthase [Trueperaceae bacterium]MCW5818478.1 o-succinylbenzoate synthase [Trueperaceae bacterium]